ncbi:hypothetical protein [Ramlibacter sp.]|nr:hypothetical protein [Ramlibacter sp.]MBA2672709.1 hypothetical protein [Ramlibacter sp.]
MNKLWIWTGRCAAALAGAALTLFIFQSYLEPPVLVPLLSGLYFCR